MPVLLAPLARLGTVLCLFLGLACHHAFQGTSTSWYHNLESPAVSCSLAGLVADYRTARPSAGNSSISVLDADSTGICTGYSDRVDGDGVGQYVRDSRHHATGVLEPPLCHHSTSSSGNRGHGDMASSREDFFKTVAGVGIGAVGALSVLPDPANALLGECNDDCPTRYLT